MTDRSQIVEPHETDEGKWQAVFSNYGHGVGKGKSRQSVYKQFKKFKDQSLLDEVSQSTGSEPSPSGTDESSSDMDPVGTSPDLESTWGKMSWAQTEANETIIPDTIPAAVRGVKGLGNAGKASAGLSRKQKELQGKVARWGFQMVDRMVTWYGRGVTGDQSYELQRSERDYDLLEETTTEVLDYYDLSIPVNPMAVWSITVASAYVPPLMEIRKKRDPSKKRWSIRSLFSRRRRKYPPIRAEVEDDESSDFRP